MHGHHIAKFILAVVLGIILGLAVYKYAISPTPAAPDTAVREIV